MQTINGRYHSTKRHAVGNAVVRPAPAWRTNEVAGPSKRYHPSAAVDLAGKESKIIITNLPQDVKEVEISVR